MMAYAYEWSHEKYDSSGDRFESGRRERAPRVQVAAKAGENVASGVPYRQVR